jgi:hypothetical protein
MKHAIINQDKRTLSAYVDMSSVIHHSNGVVTWRDKEGYHNAMIDWQFQQHIKRIYNPALLPALCNMTGNDGQRYSVNRWFDNHDEFWTAPHGARGITR